MDSAREQRAYSIPELDLQGKTALVTGGGGGLGKQMALALAGAGARLVLVGRRSQPLHETAETVAGGAIVVAGDVTLEETVTELARYADQVDILVNNAGISIHDKDWLAQTVDDWNLTLAVNVIAPFRLSQVFAPAMVERGWGRIINISSIYGILGVDVRRYREDIDHFDVPAYVASKHALIGLTRYLACRLADTGVTVNSLSPGMFPGTDQNADMEIQGLIDRLADATPMLRVGVDDDLRAAVVFLASPGSKFVTGQNLVVDGGWSVW
jgi:NAD(P)-dependent dehydrogenase (short-subunit alcohol dehydrogenase family)